MSLVDTVELRPATRSEAHGSPLVLQAGLADIPAIARLAKDAAPGPEPATVARARRLLLAHVAFEHGALFVQHDAAGVLHAAVSVIPGGTDTISRAVMSGILRTFENVLTGDQTSLRDRDEVRAALQAAHPAWIISPIAAATAGAESGGGKLLTTAVRWASDHSAPSSPLAVLADCETDRETAEWMGFIEHRISRLRSPWWFAIRPGPARDFLRDGSTENSQHLRRPRALAHCVEAEKAFNWNDHDNDADGEQQRVLTAIATATATHRHRHRNQVPDRGQRSCQATQSGGEPEERTDAGDQLTGHDVAMMSQPKKAAWLPTVPLRKSAIHGYRHPSCQRTRELVWSCRDDRLVRTQDGDVPRRDDLPRRHPPHPRLPLTTPSATA